MLDVETLRLTLAVVSLLVLALFYLGVYRPTRSPFSGWWSLALACSAASAMLLLFNGSTLQVVTNPGSTAVSVIGAASVWFATRSLRKKSSPRWPIAAAVGVAVLASVFDNPAENVWAGNLVLFVMMTTGFTGGAVEMWLTWRERREAGEYEDHPEAIRAIFVSALAATLLAILYAARTILFALFGHDSEMFTIWAGTGVTSITLMICLVAVTFSVSAIGWDQRTRDLRRRAAEDDLTGLLGRTAFMARAAETIASSGGRRSGSAWLVIADLDHFKRINDEFGHAAGDRTLVAFAGTLRTTLRPADAVGRLGGEEFGIILEDVSLESVLERLRRISVLFSHTSIVAGVPVPTVSYGVARCDAETGLSKVLENADKALYRAKNQGRDRIAVDEQDALRG